MQSFLHSIRILYTYGRHAYPLPPLHLASFICRRSAGAAVPRDPQLPLQAWPSPWPPLNLPRQTWLGSGMTELISLCVIIVCMCVLCACNVAKKTRSNTVQKIARISQIKRMTLSFDVTL